MAKDMLNDLAKAAAQFMAIRASTGIAGGGVAGFLLSSVATKGIGKLFDRPKSSQGDSAKTNPGADTGPEDVGKRIGDAAAEAIKRILDEKFKTNPNTGGPSSAGSKLPRPDDKQTAQEYVNSLTPEQLHTLRHGPGPASQAANTVAQQAAGPAMARVTGTAAGPAAAGGARAAVGAGGAGGAGAGAAGGGAAAAGAVALPVAAAVAVVYAFYEAAKAGKELAYAQEQYARKIGELNPTIAAQNAELDINRMLRDMQSGDRLASSNQDLISAINRFENSTRTFEDLGNRLKNAIAADVMNGIAQTLESIEKVIEAVYNAWKDDKNAWEKFKQGEFDGTAGTFGDFLDEMNHRTQVQKADNQRRQDANRRALDGGRDW